MYVCVCNGYREAEIRDAAAGCDDDVVAIYTALGSGPQCGHCIPFATDIVAQVRTGACCAGSQSD
jgi:bacterioferritin-associated ferredoxin